MDHYELMGELTRLIEKKINNGWNDFLKKYEGKDNYFLIYPLINIELGAMKEAPESIDNLLNRCVVGFVYNHLLKVQKHLTIQPINVKGLERYRTKVQPELEKIFQDYRTCREIKVGNAISCAKLEKKVDNEYHLITSMVTDKYKEESFYFYGFDDSEQFKRENVLIQEGHFKFWFKYVVTGYEDFKGNRMEESIDEELYTYCKSLIRKDLNKWNGNVRSTIFRSIEELCDVIGFLYYLAFIRSMRVRIINDVIGFDKSLYDILLMKYDKEWLITKISEVSRRHKNKIALIIDYLINQGGANVLEFPLFQIDNYVITVPSLIMVNDWQFTIINGHHVKGIEIKNRQKTISSITEARIDNLLSNIDNVLQAKEKYYEYIDDTGVKKNSDIDYAIYDLIHNKLLIIEAKWKDNHYYDEIDKSYVKIENTVNEIFNTQIENHKKFLDIPGNIEHLFDHNKALSSIFLPPDVFYIAVDKRSQFHKNGNHMVSEFMLLHFLKACITEVTMDLRILIDEISTLETEVKYIQCDDSYKEIKLENGNKILIEENEFSLDYYF